MKASCLCGSVAYEISGPIHNTRYCHCTHCRKFSGAAFAPWGLVQTDHLTFASPSGRVTKYYSGRGLRVFCSSCGSPMWYEPEDFPQLRGIPLGILDSADVPEPQMHVWVRSKVSWLSISDHLPQHETHP